MASVNVIAIHGTRAKDAIWPLESSILCCTLKEKLRPDFHVNWQTHKWSGINSHSAREEGAEALNRKITALPPSSKENLNVLLGHSHGGNLALMALTSDSEARKKISAVVCLSTPFIEARERKSNVWPMDFGQPLMSWLTLLAIALALSYLYSERLGVPWSVAIFLVTAWLGLTGAISLYTTIVAKEVNPAHFLRPYEYSQIPAHILSLRTRFDEALTGIRGFTHLSAVSNILPATLAFVGAFLMIIPLTSVIAGIPLFIIMDVTPRQALGWMFPLGLALIIFYPFVIVPMQLLRAMFQWLSMGEDPRIGFRFIFNVAASPTQLRYFEEHVVTEFRNSSRLKFRFNHSRLHSIPETTIPIAEMIRSYRFEEDRPSTIPKAQNLWSLGTEVDWIEWIGLEHILGASLRTVFLALGMATFVGIAAFEIVVRSPLGSVFFFVALTVLARVILPVSRRPPASLFRFSMLLSAPLSLVLVWFSWLNGSITVARAFSYFLSDLVGSFAFLIFLVVVRALKRPSDAGPDYLDSTPEWIYRCASILRLIYPKMGFVWAEAEAEKLSQRKDFRLQSPEMAAARFEAQGSSD